MQHRSQADAYILDGVPFRALGLAATTSQSRASATLPFPTP